MKLFLLRHGTAEDAHVSGEDSLRELTKEGRQEASNAGRYYREQGWKADVVLTSPYRRAVHTAILFCEAAGIDAGPEDAEFLASGMTVEQALSGLRPHGDREAVVIVGHQPDFGDLVAYLTGLSYGEVRVGKGSLWELEVSVWKEEGAKAGIYLSAKDMRS